MNFQDIQPSPVTLPNGMILNYVRAGEGFPLIFIHGAMGDWRAWAPQWEVFTARFDCISYSRRYSYPNPNPMNTRQHNAWVDAEDLKDLMDVLSIDKAILVGSSYGGFTALTTALNHPERIAALVSVEAPMMRYASATPEGAEVARTFRETTVVPSREAFEAGDNDTGISILTGGIVGSKPKDIPPHILERRKQNMDAARSLALSDDEFPLLASDALAKLSMPVMLMTGADTAPVHKAIFTGVRMAMPQATIEVIANSGHGASQQQPEQFNKKVLAFLSAQHQIG